MTLSATEETPKDGELFDSAVRELAERFAASKRVVVVCGAGISTASGIPDFRSPKTGLYASIPSAEHVFDSETFREDPKVFYDFAHQHLFPYVERSAPSKTHHFLARFSPKIRRVYTQNIDGLELDAGVPKNKLVYTHGHLKSATCMSCRKALETDGWWWRQARDPSSGVARCPLCDRGVLKPNITMFGERVKTSFFQRLERDLASADLVLCMGTSLTVEPLAGAVLRGSAGGEATYAWINKLAFRPAKRSFQELEFKPTLLGECDEVVEALERALQDNNGSRPRKRRRRAEPEAQPGGTLASQ